VTDAQKEGLGDRPDYADWAQDVMATLEARRRTERISTPAKRQRPRVSHALRDSLRRLIATARSS
jgi:hypothetical protein